MSAAAERKPFLDAAMLHFLLDPAKSSGYEMLRLNLLQFCIQQELRVSRKKSPIPGSKKGFTILYHVSRGPHFQFPGKSPLSSPFLTFFARKDVVFPLPFYAHKLILDVGDDYDKYKRNFVAPVLREYGLITTKKILGIHKHQRTPQGEAVVNYLKEELDQINEHWDTWITSTSTDFSRFVDRTGFLFLLSSHISFSDLGTNRTTLAEGMLDYVKEEKKTTVSRPLPDSHLSFTNIFGALTSDQFSFGIFEEPFSGNLEIGFESEFDEVDVFQALKKRKRAQ